ncbi:MAG: succinate dehydrogenase [Rhizobiales bacterium]|nr:succinate dehydrogenase [Hyphomicrobiales bacterium]
MNVRLYIWQRSTAALMLPLILVHLALIFYATGKGLKAEDILARTRGSIAWASFYGIFVMAAAIHSAIGIRSILIEWLCLSTRQANLLAVSLGAALLVLGFRAIAAVVLHG